MIYLCGKPDYTVSSFELCWSLKNENAIIIAGFTEAGICNSLFTIVSDCTCPGYYSQYECTVTGGIATVWKGTAFNCPSNDNEIVLLHAHSTESAETCNNGAIIGRVISTDNGTYTSQLMVRISPEMSSSTITCAYDNGDMDTPVIYSTLLNITQGIMNIN